MGACFSSLPCLPNPSSLPPPPPTAKVVSLHGHLREYPLPISVSRVLQTEDSSSSTSDSFLCNSDRLYYDDFIPPMPLDDHLQTNQIYFLLPSSKLHQRLSASDMAALAVKASVALQNASANDPLSRKKGRISPIMLLNPSDSDGEISNDKAKVNDNDEHEQAQAPLKKNNGAGMSRSSSVKRFQRLTSRRAKMAVRSFKLRLSTIYEGTIL